MKDSTCRGAAMRANRDAPFGSAGEKCPRTRRSRRWWLGIAIVLATLPRPLLSQDMTVPVDLQVTLISKILAFDRQLEERAGDEIVVGIVYQRLHRPSLNAMDAAMEAFEAGIADPKPGCRLRFLPIEISDELVLSAAIKEHAVDILYITPLRAVRVADLLKATEDESILTFTGVERHVREGVAVAIVSRGGRPSILLNLSAAKAQGADFSSHFLALAQIIDEPPQGE